MSNAKVDVLKLRNFERILIKAQHTCLERLDQQENSNFLLFSKEQELKRKDEVYNVKCKMVTIYKPLYRIKDVFKANEIEEIDLKDLKEEMLQIQKNIDILKKEAAEHLEELKNEELALIKEITMYEDKVAEWEKPSDIKDNAILVPKRISTSANNLCQEAKNFLYFVAKSEGHENGWAVEDHRLFLKMRSTSKTITHLAQTLHKILPDISEEEIVAHEEWYKKYLELKEKQKNAIQLWRTAKNACTTSGRQCVSAPASKVKSRFPANKITKQEIAAWKQKREKKLKQELYDKRFEKIKAKQSNELKRKKNEEIKKEISKWKNVKLFETQMNKIALEKEQRQEKQLKAAEANKLIKQFRSQDDVYIEKKRLLLNMRDTRAKSEERVIKPKVIAPRDPERILKPTKNWLSKLKDQDQESVKKLSVYNIQNIEKLHFPEWRKGVL